MTALLLLAQPPSGGQVEQIARTFGVNWPQFGAQVVSFAIVCALLYRFAYRPVLAMLAERRQQIALGLANAEQIKAELARHRGPAPGGDGGGQRRRPTQLDRGGARGRRPRAAARRRGRRSPPPSRSWPRAREAAAQDHARMLAELKREVGRLVVQTTAAVTGKVLTPDDQRRLAEETAKRLPA